MRKIAATRRILADALGHFDTDDGWSMASHLALSALIALVAAFLFLITPMIPPSLGGLR